MPEGENSVVNQSAAQDTSASEATADSTASETSNDSAQTSTDVDQSNEGYVDESGMVVIDEAKPQQDGGEKTDPETTGRETDPDESKRGANTRIRELANQNRSLRDELAQRDRMFERAAAINERAYQVESADDVPTVEYLMENEIDPDTGEYYTKDAARIYRMETLDQIRQQQTQLSEYSRQVADNQNRMLTEAEQAIRDFPMFDAETSEYNSEIAQAVDAELAANVIVDERTKQLIGVRRSVYDIYRTANALYEAGRVGGQVAGQRSAEQMMARADNVGSGQRSSSTKSFEDMTTSEMEVELRKQGRDV